MVHRLELLVVAPSILLSLLSSSLAPVALRYAWRGRSRSDLRSVIATSSVWNIAREEYASASSSIPSDLEISGIYDLPR